MPKSDCSDTSVIRRAGEAVSSLVLEKVHQSKMLCSDNWSRSRSSEDLIKLHLEDRISEVDCWRGILGALSKRLNDQMSLLTVEKENLGVVVMRIIEEIRNHVYRGVKNPAEPFSKESVETELANELKLLRNERLKFARKVSELERTLEELAWTRHAINQDVQLKNHGIRVDKMLAIYGPEPSMLSIANFKAKKLRPKETWLQQCERLQMEGERGIATAATLREECRGMRAQLSCAAHAQADRVDAALHRRIHYTKTNLNDLRWQMQEVDRDIQSLVVEESETEQTMHRCLAKQQLTQATLVARASKAETELCDDDAAQRLKMEVARLRSSVRELGKNLDNIQMLRNSLTSVRAEIVCYMADREASLGLDTDRIRHRESLLQDERGDGNSGFTRGAAVESRETRETTSVLEVIYECDEINEGQ